MTFISRLGGAAALFACLGAGPASAQGPVAAQPARWHLDGATSRCVLTRRLEGTPSAATFILRTIPGSGRYDVIIAGRDLPAALRRTNLEAGIVAAPARVAYQGRTRTIDLPGELGSGLALGPLPASFAAEFARATSLRVVSDAGAELGSWTVPVAARAAAALATCEAEKQVDWGADPASVEAGATPARPLNADEAWITRRDLGLTNAMATVAFAAVFRLVVGADGRATGCEIVESVGNIDIQDACRALVRRARYAPARDARGNPVRSVAIHIVSVEMETYFRPQG